VGLLDTPNKDDMRDSIHRKLCDISRWGIPISKKQLTFLNGISDRRNKLVHNALFKIKSVTKTDVENLEKVARYFNKMREKQKKDNPKIFPKLSKRQKLLIRLYVSIPFQLK